MNDSRMGWSLEKTLPVRDQIRPESCETIKDSPTKRTRVFQCVQKQLKRTSAACPAIDCPGRL